MDKYKQRAKRPESFWVELIQLWKEAGEPPKSRFAQQNGVPASTFGWWVKQLEAGRRPGQRRPENGIRKVYTSVYLTAQQHSQLVRLAEATHLSLAEYLRRGAELVLQENADKLPELQQRELPLKDGTNG